MAGAAIPRGPSHCRGGDKRRRIQVLRQRDEIAKEASLALIQPIGSLAVMMIEPDMAVWLLYPISIVVNC